MTKKYTEEDLKNAYNLIDFKKELLKSIKETFLFSKQKEMMQQLTPEYIQFHDSDKALKEAKESFRKDQVNKIKEFLSTKLYYKGRGANHGQWESFEKEESFIELIKPHSWKTLGMIRLFYYINEYPELFKGHEIKIEIKLNSCDWDTVFEGWVDNITDLKNVLKYIGIPDNIK